MNIDFQRFYSFVLSALDDQFEERYQTPRSRSKNSATPGVKFSTHFSVFGNPDESLFLVFDIGRFSFECRKTKTKVITLTNHNSRKQSNEPIRARSKYMSPVPSAG